jgi:hypothetical protein
MIGITFNIMLIHACANRARHYWTRVCTAHPLPSYTRSPSDAYSPHIKPHFTNEATTVDFGSNSNNDSIRGARVIPIDRELGAYLQLRSSHSATNTRQITPQPGPSESSLYLKHALPVFVCFISLSLDSFYLIGISKYSMFYIIFIW